MNVNLRDPNIIMKLSRLGSFHQSRLSFLRSFLSEFKDWDYKRDLFDLDEKGYGTAVYSFKKSDRVYSLVCFANKINDDEIVIGYVYGGIEAFVPNPESYGPSKSRASNVVFKVILKKE